MIKFKPIQSFSRLTGIHTGLSAKKLRSRYSTPESNFLKVEGMELHYRVTGTGPALLLIHGVASSLHTWTDWHRLLSDDFTVISVDVPGFGLTGPHPGGEYTTTMYGRVFSALFDHLDIDAAFVAGNSLGGFLAWNLALLHPDRVKKMVLLNAAGLNTKRNEVSDIGFLLATHPVSQGLTHYLTPQSLIRSSLVNAVHDPALITPGKVKLYYELLLRRGNRKAFSRILSDLIINDADHRQELRMIKTPALILWGEYDNLIPPHFGIEMARALPDARLIIYENVGHLPMEEIPGRSADDTRKFLKSN